jgi:hypothetical protein
VWAGSVLIIVGAPSAIACAWLVFDSLRQAYAPNAGGAGLGGGIVAGFFLLAGIFCAACVAIGVALLLTARRVALLSEQSLTRQ